ncbi:RNase P and RNase MRP subunit [Coemansia erecta]|nr:RNase P and RNase MRP subunit [Coemansia erecta]KAJ2889098.1 RNase P and RNase MRP subunit [Coemansia asiatica]
MVATVVNAAGSARALGEKHRRTVFKHALEKPFVTQWPVIDYQVKEDIFNSLCDALQPLSAYFAESRRISKQLSLRKRRNARALAKAKKEKNKNNNKDGGCQDEQAGQKAESEKEPAASSVRQLIADSMESSKTEAAKAGIALLDYIVIGINGTTRALEKQVHAKELDAAINDGQNKKAEPKRDLALVVVCKADLDVQMVAHFPALAHLANENLVKQSPSSGGLRLVGLVKGSENKLAAAIGHETVSVIGIRAGSTVLDPIIEKAQMCVPAPRVAWISTEDENAAKANQMLCPMAVRELQTTAPVQKKKHDTGSNNVDNKDLEKRKSQKQTEISAPTNKKSKKK